MWAGWGAAGWVELAQHAMCGEVQAAGGLPGLRGRMDTDLSALWWPPLLPLAVQGHPAGLAACDCHVT